MSFSVGIIGLPNVGKSTLFNALTKTHQAESSNFPFTTIEPNKGQIKVPDKRLIQVSEAAESENTVPTHIEFIDIAGLVEKAHRGEGLGNQFLSQIRQVDAILHVVRLFEDQNISHPLETIEPVRDIEIINSELILKDLEVIERKINKDKKQAQHDDEIKEQIEILKRWKEALENERFLSELEIKSDTEKALRKELNLLTDKPVAFAANVSEDQLTDIDEVLKPIRDNFQAPVVPVIAGIESELIDLERKERKKYRQNLGMEESTLDRVIETCYEMLELITFFTPTDKETRAWTVKQGTKAPEAGGQIHSDFEEGFIKVEVIGWKDFVSNNGWKEARNKGLVKQKGKDYIIQDGDVCMFKFSN